MYFQFTRINHNEFPAKQICKYAKTNSTDCDADVVNVSVDVFVRGEPAGDPPPKAS